MSQSSIMYFENNTNRSALFRFWFWIVNRNCETILFKMVCKLLNLSKSKGTALFFVYSFECTVWNTQKQRCLFIFWLILTIHIRDVSQIQIFYSKSNSDNCSWICIVLTYKVINGSCLIHFWWIALISTSFLRELSHKSEHVFKIDVAQTATILPVVWVIEVFTVTISVGGCVSLGILLTWTPSSR